MKRNLPQYFLHKPRLNILADHDLTIVGDYSFVAHFNGVTWQYFDQLRTTDIGLWSVAQRGNLLFAVGYLYDPINSRAIVFRGER